MKSRWHVFLAAALLCAAPAAPAFGQGVITQWNFPSGFNATNPAPSTGSGTASLIGGTTGTSLTTALSVGGSTEAVAGSLCWQVATFPADGTASGTAGVRFNVNTTGQSNLIFRFDDQPSSSSSRYMRVEYTLNGSTWNTAATLDSNYAHNNWYNNRTVDLSGVSGANNNASFGVRIVSIFNPDGSTYAPANPSGTYGVSGTWRLDAVTLSSGNVWSGGGANTSLGTAGNYSGGNAPTSTGTVLFGSGGGSNTSAATGGSGTTLDQVVFQSSAPSYTISGSGTLTLHAGIVHNSANTQTISAPVAFGLSNAIQSSAGGTLTLGNNVTFTNYLTLIGNGATTLNGTVQGSPSALTSNNPATATIRVTDGSSLAGFGTIGSVGTKNDVSVLAGGAIRAGDPNGSIAERTSPLTVNGNLTINPNGILKVEASRTGMDSAASGVLIVSGGIFNFNLMTGEKFTIDLVNGANSLQVGETYTIQLASVSGGGANLVINNIAIGSNVTVDPSYYTLTSSSFAFSNVSLTTGTAGADLNLNFTITPVPEPATVLGIAAGVLGLGAWIRRLVRARAALAA